jgi:hypothetical protein
MEIPYLVIFYAFLIFGCLVGSGVLMPVAFKTAVFFFRVASPCNLVEDHGSF